MAKVSWWLFLLLLLKTAQSQPSHKLHMSLVGAVVLEQIYNSNSSKVRVREREIGLRASWWPTNNNWCSTQCKQIRCMGHTGTFTDDRAAIYLQTQQQQHPNICSLFAYYPSRELIRATATYTHTCCLTWHHKAISR